VKLVGVPTAGANSSDDDGPPAPSPTSPNYVTLFNAWVKARAAWWAALTPQRRWYHLAQDQAPRVAVAMKGRPDPSSHPQPTDVAAYLTKNNVSPVFLYPDWNWHPQVPTPALPADLGKVTDTMQATVNIGANDKAVWWANTDGAWGYDHKTGVDLSTVLGDLISDFDSAVFTFVGDIVKPFADIIGLGDSAAQLQTLIQSNLAKNKATIDAQANT
jgi:hypothetical protein